MTEQLFTGTLTINQPNQPFYILCLHTGFFQDRIFLELHIFSIQFYICVDNIYIKEEYDTKLAINMQFTENFSILKQI